jgi:hypothetical protein
MTSIHIKIDYDQAITMKKDILVTEKELLETAKHMKAYDSLRKKEFLIKNRLKKDIEILYKLINSVEGDLPKEELSQTANRAIKTVLKEKIEIPKKVTIEAKRNNIEKQIDEIREKLARLG